ncbi:hypothetical protein LPJ66_000566 [Kickxella alabastrina]|uniref:Uncharacterized protein n=1 Tax=Kickxella alabastrina TaxID=61397 RepID=A0ACC1IVL1_9FUNG|nr:hypothetical protein LPJ66_000566 [Kickxella alabastrina]
MTGPIVISGFKSNIIGNLQPGVDAYSKAIMRNLNTNEYVFTRPFCTSGRYMDIGSPLISRISWSSNPSILLRSDGTIHHGAWAGYCFDIVSVDDIDDDSDATWKDITESELARISKIYGDNHWNREL